MQKKNLKKPGIWEVMKKILEKTENLNKNPYKKIEILTNFYILSSKILVLLKNFLSYLSCR